MTAAEFEAAVRRASMIVEHDAARNGSVHESFVIGLLTLIYDLAGDGAGHAIRALLVAAETGALRKVEVSALLEELSTNGPQ